MKIHFPLFMAFVLALRVGTVLAQLEVFHQYRFSDHYAALSYKGDTLRLGLLGGVNACQLCALDFNLDGKPDVLAFDRHGNRIIPFIAGNKVLMPDFRYLPMLPPLHEWVRTADYDHDGHMDLFTSTTGGIKVYKNISDTALKFKQVTYPYITSLQGSVRTNILATNVDYPAITDLDGDGDLDILVFWGLGSFVEWHKNTSVEHYGNADTLEFTKVSSCWGRFAEGLENNQITLDTCQAGKSLETGEKHTGSTLLVSDFNQDGLPDLALGDVDYEGLILLTNGGTLKDARMVAPTSQFPPSTTPVELADFPAAMKLDVSGDGQDDIVVSPFEASLNKAADRQSVWYYQNSGTNLNPNYILQSKSFLQGEMLDFGSGCYPAAFDANGDGLTDLLVGNYGQFDSSWFSPLLGLKSHFHSSVSLLLNVGTATDPLFRLTDEDVAGLSSLDVLGLTPTLADLDGDGDVDLVCGRADGHLLFCENTALPGETAHFVLRDEDAFGVDAGDYSAPCLFDVDGDGLTDLVVGRRDGRLSYYKNIGPANSPHFVLLDNYWGQVDVTDTDLSNYGYATPNLYKDQQGNLALLCGSEFGALHLYDQISATSGAVFRQHTTIPGLHNGWRVGAGLASLNGDTLADLVVGNYAGGLEYYEGTMEALQGKPKPGIRAKAALICTPNPAKETIHFGQENALREPMDLTIVNALGLLVYSANSVVLPFSFDCSQLAPGIYFVNVQGRMALLQSKFIKF